KTQKQLAALKFRCDRIFRSLSKDWFVQRDNSNRYDLVLAKGQCHRNASKLVMLFVQTWFVMNRSPKNIPDMMDAGDMKDKFVCDLYAWYDPETGDVTESNNNSRTTGDHLPQKPSFELNTL
ncbi:unnamed protein product, partial [Amoebophrya sp. A120]